MMMRKYTRIGQLLMCLLLTGSLALSSTVWAEDQEKTKDLSKVEKEVKARTNEKAEQKRDTIVREAVTALEQTKKAIEALKKKDKQAAIDALAVITGKLQVVVAMAPGMANAPIDVRVEQFDLYATADAVRKAVKTAENLLEDGEVQQARVLLSGLASEINIVVTSLPLKAYAEGIKAVAKLVDEDKFEEATEQLYELLSTTVITRHIIPLPILRVEELLKKAEKLTEAEGRTDEQNKELTSLLDKAVAQLEMAEALGYGDKKAYKEFYQQIKKIRKKTKGGKFGSGILDELKESLRNFKEKFFKDSDKSEK
jgi:predicted phage tail protein